MKTKEGTAATAHTTTATVIAAHIQPAAAPAPSTHHRAARVPSAAAMTAKVAAGAAASKAALPAAIITVVAIAVTARAARATAATADLAAAPQQARPTPPPKPPVRPSSPRVLPADLLISPQPSERGGAIPTREASADRRRPSVSFKCAADDFLHEEQQANAPDGSSSIIATGCTATPSDSFGAEMQEEMTTDDILRQAAARAMEREQNKAMKASGGGPRRDSLAGRRDSVLDRAGGSRRGSLKRDPTADPDRIDKDSVDFEIGADGQFKLVQKRAPPPGEENLQRRGSRS